MLRIVVLDGHTLNPGDLKWDALQALGACTIYDRTAPELVLQRAADAQILLTNKTVLDHPLHDTQPLVHIRHRMLT